MTDFATNVDPAGNNLILIPPNEWLYAGKPVPVSPHLQIGKNVKYLGLVVVDNYGLIGRSRQGWSGHFQDFQKAYHNIAIIPVEEIGFWYIAGPVDYRNSYTVNDASIFPLQLKVIAFDNKLNPVETAQLGWSMLHPASERGLDGYNRFHQLYYSLLQQTDYVLTSFPNSIDINFLLDDQDINLNLCHKGSIHLTYPDYLQLSMNLKKIISKDENLGMDIALKPGSHFWWCSQTQPRPIRYFTHHPSQNTHELANTVNETALTYIKEAMQYVKVTYPENFRSLSNGLTLNFKVTCQHDEDHDYNYPNITQPKALTFFLEFSPSSFYSGINNLKRIEEIEAIPKKDLIKLSSSTLYFNKAALFQGKSWGSDPIITFDKKRAEDPLLTHDHPYPIEVQPPFIDAESHPSLILKGSLLPQISSLKMPQGPFFRFPILETTQVLFIKMLSQKILFQGVPLFEHRYALNTYSVNVTDPIFINEDILQLKDRFTVYRKYYQLHKNNNLNNPSSYHIWVDFPVENSYLDNCYYTQKRFREDQIIPITSISAFDIKQTNALGPEPEVKKYIFKTPRRLFLKSDGFQYVTGIVRHIDQKSLQPSDFLAPSALEVDPQDLNKVVYHKGPFTGYSYKKDLIEVEAITSEEGYLKQSQFNFYAPSFTPHGPIVNTSPYIEVNQNQEKPINMTIDGPYDYLLIWDCTKGGGDLCIDGKPVGWLGPHEKTFSGTTTLPGQKLTYRGGSEPCQDLLKISAVSVTLDDKNCHHQQGPWIFVAGITK